ncbi:MAG: transglycosylase SLT domain-containing protein [Rhizobiales bacterium]|nr:transglycosylase SLT domain-containing protein [Hyphomicrobiales bacterium]
MSVVPKPTPATRPTVPQPGISPGASRVVDAIQRAAQATGASFEYLLATAKVESNFNPDLKARTSTATGLFQFIEQTWLGMMKNAGRALGFSDYADAISRNSSGRYQVSDPGLRTEILQLRRDPAANAAMAGAFTQHNAVALSQRIGRRPTDSELYMAHFFGTGGAGQLINATKDHPQANAAALFPAAARANHSIFYDRQGNARSVAGVYSELNRRYQVARAVVIPGVVSTAVAANAAAPSGATHAPDTAGTTSAFAVAGARSVVAAAAPAFHSLFHDSEGRGAVSPIVTELWGGDSASESRSVPTVTGPAQAVSAAPDPAPLDLFQDMRPDVRGLFRGNGRR